MSHRIIGNEPRCPDFHYLACAKCCFPRDQALVMERTDLSPGVTRMTGATVALVSLGLVRSAFCSAPSVDLSRGNPSLTETVRPQIQLIISLLKRWCA